MNREIANGMAIITPWMPPNSNAGVKQPSRRSGASRMRARPQRCRQQIIANIHGVHNMQVARDREAALKW